MLQPLIARKRPPTKPITTKITTIIKHIKHCGRVLLQGKSRNCDNPVNNLEAQIVSSKLLAIARKTNHLEYCNHLSRASALPQNQ